MFCFLYIINLDICLPWSSIWCFYTMVVTVQSFRTTRQQCTSSPQENSAMLIPCSGYILMLIFYSSISVVTVSWGDMTIWVYVRFWYVLPSFKSGISVYECCGLVYCYTFIINDVDFLEVPLWFQSCWINESTSILLYYVADIYKFV